MVKKRIGIREIAKLTGVSIATVSRVINSPESTSEETRKKVDDVIKKYNYVPNLVARNLFANDSSSLAVFVFDLENPFFIALIKELNKLAFQHKQALLICDTENNPEKEEEYLHYCEAIRTKGIILTEGFNYKSLSELKINQKFVCLDRKLSSNYVVVKSDNRAGITMLVNYLYNLNHRVFGFVGLTEKIASAEERYATFLDNLNDKGIEFNKEYVYRGSLNRKTGANAFDYFCSLKKPPTAIVCSNDQIAYGFISRASSQGVKVPGDFSVVGFDGCSLDYIYPKLTTIRQNIPELALELYNSIFSEDEQTKEHIVDVSFSLGETCKMLNS